MIDILGLTTAMQVRAVMGVDKSDLTDSMFDGMSLEDDLHESLHSWLPAWETIRDTGTDRQKRLLRLYAKYEVAGVVAAAAQNFIAVRKSDGANEGEMADLDLEGFEAMISRLKARAYNYRTDLIDDLDETPVSETVATLFGGVAPGRDPVTEGRS